MDESKILTQAQAIQDLMDQGLIAPMKIEVLDGQIVMQAAPRWEHSFITQKVMRQIPRDGDRVFGPVDLVLIGHEGEPQPDITVVPERLAPKAKPVSDQVDLLVEICSEGNFEDDYGKKSRLYSIGGVPQYLIIDPIKGVCILRSDPDGRGGWHSETTYRFGEPMPGITCLEGASLETGEFPIY